MLGEAAAGGNRGERTAIRRGWEYVSSQLRQVHGQGSPPYGRRLFERGGLCCGSDTAGGESNEIKAIPELLRRLDIKGATVSSDAMGCRTDIAALITQQGGHYSLCMKELQENGWREVGSCAPHVRGP